MCFILQVCAPQYYFQCNGTNSVKRMVGACYKANMNSMGTPMTEIPSPCFNRFGSLIIWTYCMRIRDCQVLFSKLFLFRYSNGKKWAHAPLLLHNTCTTISQLALLYYCIIRMVLNPSQHALQNCNMLCFQFEKDQHLKLYQMWERKMEENPHSFTSKDKIQFASMVIFGEDRFALPTRAQAS